MPAPVPPKVWATGTGNDAKIVYVQGTGPALDHGKLFPIVLVFDNFHNKISHYIQA